MSRESLFWILVASASAAATALAQPANTSTPPRLELRGESDEPLNRFRLGYRMGFNVTADFRNSSLASSSSPQSVTGLTYENGYVALDVSGNRGGRTWYWGYETANQIVGDTLQLSAFRPGALAQDVKDDPQHGLELSYERRIGRTEWFHWGVEAAFNHTWMNLETKGLAGVVHAFPLNGVIPPVAPYFGSFEGPGPLIGDTPSLFPISFNGQIDASVYGFRVGPLLEFPLGDRFSFSLSGGFSLLLVDGDFTYQQGVALPSTGLASVRSWTSDFDALPGGYLSGSLSFNVSESVSIFTSAQVETAGRMSFTAGGKQADLNFHTPVYLVVGLSYQF